MAAKDDNVRVRAKVFSTKRACVEPACGIVVARFN